MEVMYFDLVTDAELVDAIREGRRMLGDKITMMVDFGYRWRDWHDALWVLRRIEDCNIYFAEATLQHDDLHGHARLSQMSPIRICGAEFAATRWEVREWIETGKVAVVQPDISRCGGLTEIRRIADMCELYGVQVIPHGWKTGILANCGRHFQAACPNAPYLRVHFAACLSVAVARAAGPSRAGGRRRPHGAADRSRPRRRARRGCRRDLSRPGGPERHDQEELDGKRALIYGGGTGLGFACAEAMLAAGASVFITGRRMEKLAAAQETHGARGRIGARRRRFHRRS